MRNTQITVILLLPVVSCSPGRQDPPVPSATVSGVVAAGPTCPVESLEDRSCRPVPVVGSIEFVQNENVTASERLDTMGRYRITVRPGSYTVRIDVGDSPFPSCPSQEITVLEATQSILDITCDTGIR